MSSSITFHFLFLKTGALTEPGAHHFVLTGWPVESPGILLSVYNLEPQSCAARPGFYVCAWDLSSGSHDFQQSRFPVSTVATEPSSQPNINIFFFFIISAKYSSRFRVLRLVTLPDFYFPVILISHCKCLF